MLLTPNIKLDNNLYTEGEFSAFEIRKVYEDEDYFIAYYLKKKIIQLLIKIS